MIIADSIVKYGSSISQKSIVGKLYQFKNSHPGIIKTFNSSLIEKILKIDRSTIELWASEYKSLKPKNTRRELPKIENPPTNPVMRIAPNPNYSPTMGNLKTIILNAHFAKKLNAKLHLRFDDTTGLKIGIAHAKKSYARAVKMFYNSNFKQYAASDRSLIYDTAIIELFNMGHLYLCRCSRDRHSEFKAKRQNCNCYYESQNSDAITEFYNRAKSGTAVIRFRCNAFTDIMNWPVMRILKSGQKCPLLNFQSAIDDRVEKINLILRGKDLMASEVAQKTLYRKMGWQYPRCIYWGRNKIAGLTMSSSALVKSGISDIDPCAPTFENLISLGLPKQAIESYYIMDVGLTKNDTSLNISQLISRAERAKSQIHKIEPGHLESINYRVAVFLSSKNRVIKLPKLGLDVIIKKGEWFKYKGVLYAYSHHGKLVQLTN